MNSKSYLFLLFLSSLLILSSCSGELPNCTDKDTDYVKYDWNEELKSCEIIKKIDKNKCGNGVQEGSETFCNCPKDVDKKLDIEEGGCSGNKGDYLEYVCNDKKICELEVTDKVKKNSKLISLKSGSNFAIDAQVYYYLPFMLDRHNVEVEFLLKDIADTKTIKVRDVIIRKIYLVTQSKDLLSSQTSNAQFGEKFSIIKTKIPLNEFSLDTFNKDVKNVYLKLLISYTKDTYDSKGETIIKTETLEIEVQELFESKLAIIDPQNKNEELDGAGGEWDI